MRRRLVFHTYYTIATKLAVTTTIEPVFSTRQPIEEDEERAIAEGETTENYYRIRVGNYRIGFVENEDPIIFVRVLHRREMYRYFP